MAIDTIAAIGSQGNVLADINSVRQRIEEIQEQFNIKHFAPTNMTFSQALDKQMQPSTENAVQNQQTSSHKEAQPFLQSIGKNSSSVSAQNLPTGSIGDMIQSAAAKYGINPKLLSAIAETESNYQPDAVSSAGAIGVMQLMPETAAGLGVTNPYDARQNIDGGAKYLKELLDDFGGNVREAVAAYNAGPQAVKNYQGVPPYPETQNYVSHVLDLYQ